MAEPLSYHDFMVALESGEDADDTEVSEKIRIFKMQVTSVVAANLHCHTDATKGKRGMDLDDFSMMFHCESVHQ